MYTHVLRISAEALTYTAIYMHTNVQVDWQAGRQAGRQTNIPGGP